MSPKCRTTLTSSLIHYRQQNKEIHEVSLNPDPGSPTIDVSIDGVLIFGVQVDGGSSVNLMIVDTMEKLGLTSLLPTELLLRMANHSKVLPMGILINVDTNIGGITYKIDYVVFQLKSSTISYPILLGHPWLFDAKACNDWGRGTLTIGKQRNKIVLQMYPVSYHGDPNFLVKSFLLMMMIVIRMKIRIHPIEMSNLDQFSPIPIRLALYTNVVDQTNI